MGLGQWVAQDLSTVPGTALVAPGSGLTSWGQSNDGPHVVYADANGHVRQLWYTTRTGHWAAQDLTTAAAMAGIDPGCGVSGWATANDVLHAGDVHATR